MVQDCQYFIWPVILLEVMKKRFTSLGGIIFEENGLSSVHIYNDAAIVHLGDGRVMSSQLVIDAMGNFSPIVRQPNLSSAWLFQKAMSASADSGVSPTFINELVYAHFTSMQRLGKPVLQPFLQDVIQFWPLTKILGSVVLYYPQLVPSIFRQVGIAAILEWLIHFVALGHYTFLSRFIDPLIRPWIAKLPKKERYRWRRHLEAWKYGAGLDYTL